MTGPNRSRPSPQRGPALEALGALLQRHRLWLIWLAGPICYALGTLAAATSAGVGWQEAVWFDAAWFDKAWFDKAWFDSAWFDSAWFDSAWFDSAWFDSAWFDSASSETARLDTIEPEAGVSDNHEAAARRPHPAGTHTTGPHFGPGRAVAGALMALGAAWLLIGAPWILLSQAISGRFPGRAAPGAWSLAVNCLALMALVTLLRMSVGVGRAGLLLGWMGWGLLLAWLARRSVREADSLDRPLRPKTERAWPVEAVTVLIALCGVIAAMVWFGREWLLQCHSGDGTEASVLARSLKEHLLPYFEVESLGEPGFVVGSPTLVNSYWTCAFQVLLGHSEATARLPFWIWCLAIAAVGTRMLPRSATAVRWSAAAAWGLTGFFWCLWYVFYTGYYPYLADPAAPGVPDALYTLLLLVALDALRREDLGAWVLLMLLASVVLYAGPVMFALLGGAALVWRLVERRAMWRAIGWGGAALLGVLGFYIVCGLADGSFWGWPQTIYGEYVADFIAPADRWSSGWRYLLCFVLGCGGLGSAGLITAFASQRGSRQTADADQRTRRGAATPQALHRRQRTSGSRASAWHRTTATLVLAYLLIVLVSGSKNLHYLGPIIPPAVILWLRQLCRWEVARRAQLALAATAAGLIGAIVLCWPQSRPIFTLNRQLGALTTFQTQSVWEAYRWARLSEPLYRQGLISWQIGPHTWVDYSHLASSAGHAALRGRLLVTDREPPGDYQLVLRSEAGPALYVAEEDLKLRLRRPPPAGPSERFPWVFRWLLLGRIGQPGHDGRPAAGPSG